MRILIAYYSRTGTTKKVAEFLAGKLGAEIEEIKDTVDRSGVKGYLLSGRDATTRRLTEIAPLKFDPAEFDLVIVGTPIWSWNLSVPTRTYLEQNKEKFKQVAFFCTMGGSGSDRAANDGEKIIGKTIAPRLALRTVEVVKDEFFDKADKFISELGQA